MCQLVVPGRAFSEMIAGEVTGELSEAPLTVVVVVRVSVVVEMAVLVNSK